MGHPSAEKFAVVGDAINVASRIQTATRDLDVNFLVSKEVLQSVPARTARTGLQGKVHLKGKDAPMMVYEVTGLRAGDTTHNDPPKMQPNPDPELRLEVALEFSVEALKRRKYSQARPDSGMAHVLGGVVTDTKQADDFVAHILVNHPVIEQDRLANGCEKPIHHVDDIVCQVGFDESRKVAYVAKKEGQAAFFPAAVANVLELQTTDVGATGEQSLYCHITLNPGLAGESGIGIPAASLGQLSLCICPF